MSVAASLFPNFLGFFLFLLSPLPVLFFFFLLSCFSIFPFIHPSISSIAPPSFAIGAGRDSRHIASFRFQSLGPFPLEQANQPNSNQTNKGQCGLCTIVATHAHLPAVLYLFMHFFSSCAGTK